MSSLPLTIHSVLSGPRPFIRDVNLKPERSEYNGNCVEIDSNHVLRWEEITLANLKPAFKGVLNLPFAGGASAEASTPSVYPIKNPRDVKSMALGHLGPLLERPVAAGATEVGNRMRRQFPQVDMGRDKKLASGLRPALSFFFEYGQRREWLVLGIPRLHTAWNSSFLATDNSHTLDLGPLPQLGIYARDGGTQYTFIVTEEEVVVVRFFLVDSGQPERYGVEWKAIPWNETDSNALTGKLAIWFLVMMALDERERRPQARASTRPVNAWGRFTNSERIVRFRHPLSREESDLLPADALAD